MSTARTALRSSLPTAGGSGCAASTGPTRCTRPTQGLLPALGTGCLLVRDGAVLRAAHSGADAPYVQDIGEHDPPDFVAISPELTRGFRGLRLWLPLHLHGVAAFRAALDQKLDLTGHAYRVLRAEPTLNVLGPPQLTTVAFRRVLTGADDAAEDAATADLLRRVNAERRVFLSSTRIAGRYVGRISVLNHRTDRARVDEALDAIRRHTAPG